LPAPSVTLLKIWSVLTRWLLAAVLLFWLLFAVGWGALHWLIVPRIGDWRPQLQARASEVLGVPVRVGAVVARSNGLVPSFELSNVQLFDAQGRVALNLQRVLVSVSPRSLWHLGFEQIYIDQPTLDVRRGRDGKITVAGLELTDASQSETPALNWVFSQLELVVAKGVLRWTDELQGTPPVALSDVGVLVRNVGRHHDMRLDATPPLEWGERFSLRGRFVQPLLERQKGRWQQWEGQLFAAFDRVDVSQLGRFAKLDFALNQGVGAVRAWVDVSQARVTGGAADVALSEVSVKLAPELRELALQRLQGRLGLRLLSGGFELSTRSLAFDTPEGLHWPGGNVRYLTVDDPAQGARGQLQADRLDLAALAQIADRLPLQAQWRERLINYAPKGRVDSLSASWRGPIDAPTWYAAQGQLRQIEVAAVAGMPGVRALDVDFDFDQSAGRAKVSMAAGSVDLPGILAEPRVALDELSTQARWQHRGDDWSVDLPDVHFANADAQGQVSVKWRTSDANGSAAHKRFPGVLDLQATLSRADARQVHRYLPLVIDQAARDYVREAILAGNASQVRFVVQGELDQLPQGDARQGTFRITVPVRQVKLAFVPNSLQPAGELPWPALSEIDGEVVIDRAQLQVKVTRARMGEGGALRVTRAQASIADLRRPRVLVDAAFNGPLSEALRTVKTSPLNALTAQALNEAKGTGLADFTLKLTLPIAELDKSTVQGSVRLANSDFQITATAPRLTRARGLVSYTEKALTLTGVQGRLFGGDARLDGGLLYASAAAEARLGAPAIRISGVATAEGLRQVQELGFVARLARYVEGSTGYNAVLGLRSGAPDLLVTSTLQGMGSSLPAPLGKEATLSLPLRVHWGLSEATLPEQDRVSLSLGQLAQVVYERDTSHAPARVLRGSISVGAETLGSLILPAQGVNANLQVSRLDVDAWSTALAQLGLQASSVGARTDVGTDYLPSTLALRADSLVVGGRDFNQLVVGADREGTLWRANIDATELNGYLEYRQAADTGAASAGGVYARLARLTLVPSAVNQVESLMDAQPTSLPALDVVVDAFELRGKQLGRLEMEAVNRSAQATTDAPGLREWRLHKFNLTVPEATLTASGNWARINAQAQLAGASVAAVPERRRTVMNFKLDMRDGGKLLERFGMPGVVRQASGKIEGQAAWVGSPLKPDYPSLGGAFTVNVASGQFLKADPGLAKLLGVLSLQALPRRLTLDFRDVFSDGFAFDFLRGDVTVDKGIAHTNNLQMKGVNAAVLMDGQANITNETQDLKVVVVPEINAGTASLIATVINPAVGLGTFLAQWLLRRPLMDSATQEFHVDGSWADPHVTKIKSSASSAGSSKENKP